MPCLTSGVLILIRVCNKQTGLIYETAYVLPPVEKIPYYSH